MGEHFHPPEKFARNFIRLNAKEVLDLRARDDHGNTVRETHHYRARYELNDGAKPVAPRITINIPASGVHMKRPSSPYFATVPYTTTTKAPVGPPICVVEPPSAEIKKP